MSEIERPEPEELFQLDEELILQTGPFKARWKVKDVLPNGMVLTYVEDSVWFCGWPSTVTAPDGTPLTLDRTETFIGRAHWGEVTRAEDL